MYMYMYVYIYIYIYVIMCICNSLLKCYCGKFVFLLVVLLDTKYVLRFVINPFLRKNVNVQKWTKTCREVHMSWCQRVLSRGDNPNLLTSTLYFVEPIDGQTLKTKYLAVSACQHREIKNMLRFYVPLND